MPELVHGPIPLERLIAASSRPDCGAVVVFLGTTRDHHEGRRVIGLSYEAYEPMALAALETLEREAERRFEIASCRVVHRLGPVPLAEASVAVLVASAHRAAGFEASHWAMDELKRRVPIWKRETYAEGDAAWVGGTRLE